jgi:hypothetical protein
LLTDQGYQILWIEMPAIGDSGQKLYDRLFNLAQGAVTRLNVRSALNPALWLCGIVTPAALLGAALTGGTLQLAMIALATAPVLVCCAGYIYFMITDSDKLQSETFQLRKQALDLIEQKGDVIQVDVTSIEAISNPELPQLPATNPEPRQLDNG